MSSSAEQLAANASWQTFAKAKDLQARIWFTLGMLLIYRVGTVVPLPGIDIAAFRAFSPTHRVFSNRLTCLPVAR